MAIQFHEIRIPALSRNPKVQQYAWITATGVDVGYDVTVVKPGNPKRRVAGQWKGGWVGRIAHSAGTDGFNNPGWDLHLKYVPADSTAEDAEVNVGDTETVTVTVIPPSGDPGSSDTQTDTVP